jgi:hypothetical protein
LGWIPVVDKVFADVSIGDGPERRPGDQDGAQEKGATLVDRAHVDLRESDQATERYTITTVQVSP